MTECRTCRIISLLLGKKILLPLIGRHYALCRIREVKHEVRGLDLEIVGGLATRGYTTNDVDVIGDKRDIPELAHRLRRGGITEPIHWCGSRNGKHSHARCAYYGVKMVLTGKGY